MGTILFFLRLKVENNYGSMGVFQRIFQLDLIGTAVFIPAIVCLILALQWGGATHPWNDSRVYGLFIGFGLLIIVFIGIQLWKGDKGTLPPKLFKNRNVLCALLFGMFFGAAFFPLIYYLCKYPTLLQDAR
jgi:Fungal trichothecene efflux pump (TRI12)